MIEPRPYQLEAIEAIQEARGRGISRQLISLPTGTGKTVIFSLLAGEMNVKTLILAHREELITQAANKIKMVCADLNVGIVMAEQNEVDKQVVVASIQTASRSSRLAQLKGQGFQLLIIDEAHHAASNTYQTAVEELGFLEDNSNKLLIGVTATARRGDKRPLGDIFQEVVFERSIAAMIKAQYLADLKGKRVLTQVDLNHVALIGGDFNESQLAKVVNTSERNQIVINAYKQHALNRKTIAFCVDVSHSKDLAQAFKTEGISAAAVYGSMPKEERQSLLKAFSEGKIQVLTNCNLLTEGYDEPSISCVLMARPTRSLALYTQAVGRGTRLYPGKEDCLIIDFTDSCHDLCSFAMLEGLAQENKPDAMRTQHLASQEQRLPQSSQATYKSTEDLDLFKRSNFAWIQIKDNWFIRLTPDRAIALSKKESGFAVELVYKDSRLLLSKHELSLEYAQGVAEDWIRKNEVNLTLAQKDAEWRFRPATNKQLQTLKEMGILVEQLSRGEASEIIQKKLGSNKYGELATDRQLNFLRRFGIPFQKGITKGEAGRLIAQRQAKY